VLFWSVPPTLQSDFLSFPIGLSNSTVVLPSVPGRAVTLIYKYKQFFLQLNVVYIEHGQITMRQSLLIKRK
jgi:hypothetical protein